MNIKRGSIVMVNSDSEFISKRDYVLRLTSPTMSSPMGLIKSGRKGWVVNSETTLYGEVLVLFDELSPVGVGRDRLVLISDEKDTYHHDDLQAHKRNCKEAAN